MQIWQALVLGVVEGITEFLPISSTGHLILVSHLLQIEQTEFVKTFEIVIQTGAILAVVLLYWKRLFTSHTLIRQLILAFIPTVVIGAIFYSVIKNVLLENIWITIGALIIGGIVFLLIDIIANKRNNHISTQQLSSIQNIAIGIGQAVSIIPGVSRSGATIFSGMITGLTRKDAVEFSFLLAIPTIFAATAYDLIKTPLTFSNQEILLLITGWCMSFVSAIIAVKLFIQFISNHSFVYVAVYRIAIGIIFIFLLR